MNKNSIFCLFTLILLSGCYTVLKLPPPKTNCQKLTSYVWVKREGHYSKLPDGVASLGYIDHYLDFNNIGKYYYGMFSLATSSASNYKCHGDTLKIYLGNRFDYYLIKFNLDYLELIEIFDSDTSKNLYSRPIKYDGVWRRK